MIGTIGLFAPYDWPERIKSKFVAWPGKQKRTETNSGAPTNSDAEKDSDAETNSAVETNSEKDSTTVLKTSAAMLIFLHLYLIMQLVIPLRRFLYPGETSWTELGHRFSWSMMLRTKLIQSFDATIVNPQTNQQIHVNLSKHMSPKQVFHMQTRPDMILRYAHYIADVEEKKLGVRPKVFIRAIESLNLRPVQDLIDPNVDLAKEQDTLMAPRWIIPLNPTLTLGPQKRVITNTDHDRPMTDTP